MSWRTAGAPSPAEHRETTPATPGPWSQPARSCGLNGSRHAERRGKSSSRTYVRDSLEPAVATTLPVTPEPLVRTGGAVPAYFAGLLPEGRRLGALRRAVKTSADDELSLL